MEKLAWEDENFINKPENISLRMQMELQRPYQVLSEAGIKSTVAVFGSARVKKDSDKNKHLSHWLDVAEHFSYRVTNELSKPSGYTEYVIATGAGPSIMEAANKGAKMAHGKSLGMAIKLPWESNSNEWVDPEFDFLFKYFSLRKFMMMKYARAIVAFPGGVGTFEEILEAITLVQTKKMPDLPIILFGVAFWQPLIKQMQYFEDNGLASANDFSKILCTDNIDEAVSYIKNYYSAMEFS